MTIGRDGKEMSDCCRWKCGQTSDLLPEVCDACRIQLEEFRAWLRQYHGTFLVVES